MHMATYRDRLTGDLHMPGKRNIEALTASIEARHQEMACIGVLEAAHQSIGGMGPKVAAHRIKALGRLDRPSARQARGGQCEVRLRIS